MMRKLLIVAFVAFMAWMWTLIRNEPLPIPADSPVATQLSSVEQDYYKQVFNYTMDAVEPGKSYVWESYSASGSISVSKLFTSSSGYTCRNFSERITVGGAESSDNGIACKRQGRDGWCRLQKTDALTCAMEAPDNLFDRGLRGMGDAAESAKGVLGNIKDRLR